MNGRILYIFSTKALMYAGAGTMIGILFYFLCGLIELQIVGAIIMGILALTGFVISTFKMPDIQTFEITRKTGGANLDDIIISAIKFRMKNKRIYTYAKEESDNEYK